MNNTRTLEVPGYEVIQFLGSGARSTIWHIRDSRTKKPYALKRVIKRNSEDIRFIEQAENEYEVGSKLDHPVIRHIFNINRVKQWLALREVHLLMELCEGITVQENRPDSIEETLRIFSEVAKALAYMNSVGFVHADMKPNNILIAPDGSVKIIDLGQSCVIGTVKQRIQGTPDFIAPEQVRRLPLDARTDVFNWGAALYWTLTGNPIVTVLPKQGAVTLKNDMVFVPPSQTNPTVPVPLDKLLDDCVQMNPAHRPESLSEVISRLNLIAHTIKRNLNNHGNGGN